MNISYLNSKQNITLSRKVFLTFIYIPAKLIDFAYPADLICYHSFKENWKTYPILILINKD